MLRKTSLVVLTVLAVSLTLGAAVSAADDPLAQVIKKNQANTLPVSLQFTKKNLSAIMRVIMGEGAFDANARATGFLVGDGLVMTSYHVVSGSLSGPKRKILGFGPDDGLDVAVFINGCAAKVVKVDPSADLALLRACTPRVQQVPTFRAAPPKDAEVLVIAQPGLAKTIRRGSFDGYYALGNSQYLTVKIDGEDGFSGSPVYDNAGQVVGIFSMYDAARGVGLLSPAAKALEFLAQYKFSQ
ncbi:MAG TPA: serine protease [Vicinamibacterales bacterium]|jgi:S1-C subfamily serine protease|nr:serine protease [Vicinamibacterales bacterium]